MFSKELDFFIANQDQLVKQYQGKVLAIKENHIIGVFDTPLEAYLEVQKEHAVGTFMIQPCEPGSEAYTVNIAPIY